MLAACLAIVVWVAVRASTQSTVSRAVTYFIADGTGHRGFRTGDTQLARWALADWQRHSPEALPVEAVQESDALLRVYWTESGDGRYGEMQPLSVGGQRGAAVFIQPDVSVLGPDIAARIRGDDLFRDTIVYLTCLHELGHAFGLAHTRDFRDIMYFFGFGGDIVEYFGRYRRRLMSRNDIATTSGLSAGDIQRFASGFAR